MADVKFIRPIASVQGKLKKTDNIYFRRRGDKWFAVKLANPRTEFTEKEKAVRSRFGEISKRASEIAKNPELAAPYMAGFEAQKDRKDGKENLYHYILSRLTKTE